VLVTSDVLDRLVKEAKGTLSQKARNGDFADVGLDLSLSRAQPIIQGNDSTGYKVILWPSYGKSARYVVKEDGHYKLLGTSRDEEGVGLEALDRIAANDLAGARILLDWLREDWHLAGGDDPLSSAAFPRLWTKGRDADATAMKLAAASIVAGYKQTAPQGLTVLEAARDSARTDAEKLNISLALLSGYDRLDEYDKALTVAAELAREYPESERMFYNQSFDLRALGRSEEADTLAAARLKRIPDDPAAMRVLVYDATARGDYGRAHALAHDILDKGKAEAQDLNNVAWHSLFTGKVEPSDIEDALKGAQLGNNSANILHTLGCVYAEVGKTKEAREVLIQAMDVLNLDEPDENYWYAFGRIAEQYGERDAALANYARVTKPKTSVEIPESTYYLAQVRIQALRGDKQ
jgi:tetratricopeptide (TPR) repeat protein